MTYPVIKLSSSVTIQPPVYTDTLVVKQVLELPAERTVRAEIIKSQSPYFSEWVVVWSGDAYDVAGQWTDEDLVDAICKHYEIV